MVVLVVVAAGGGGCWWRCCWRLFWVVLVAVLFVCVRHTNCVEWRCVWVWGRISMHNMRVERVLQNLPSLFLLHVVHARLPQHNTGRRKAVLECSPKEMRSARARGRRTLFCRGIANGEGGTEGVLRGLVRVEVGELALCASWAWRLGDGAVSCLVCLQGNSNAR